MTRQEAVERLEGIKSLVDKYDDVMALREAIKRWIHSSMRWLGQQVSR